MKIALNIEWIGARRGGAEKYAGMLARSLHAAGHEVHLFARGAEPGEAPADVPLHVVSLRKWPCCGWLRSYRFAAASQRALQQHSFDLIIGFNKTWFQDIYLAVAGAQRAAVEHSLQRFQSPLRRKLHAWGKALSPKQWIFDLIESKQFGPRARPMHVIAPSRFSARQFHELHGLPRWRVSVVYNGIVRESLPTNTAAQREEFRRELRLSDDDVAFLFVARNYELKGLEPLLTSFAQTAKQRPHAVLLVCGSRRDAPFRRQAAALGIVRQVRFLGSVDDVRRTFLGSDVFVMPTFYDPCSLVVPEAMQWGLPVITTEQNGAAELMKHGEEGFVTPSPWHLDELAQCMGRLADDAALRRRMSDRARARAEHLTMDTRLAELLTVLEQRNAHKAARRPQRLAA